mgnify:CR=1 FL=1
MFEDCHWADEATFDLLKFLGRRMQSTRSMLVMTYRTDEVHVRHPCRFVIGDVLAGRAASLAFVEPPAPTNPFDLYDLAINTAAGLHGRCVALTMRTSTGIDSFAPIRSIRRSSNARNSFACTLELMSPISSRNNVP